VGNREKVYEIKFSVRESLLLTRCDSFTDSSFTSDSAATTGLNKFIRRKLFLLDCVSVSECNVRSSKLITWEENE
jgi:hypothetical protein